jgi:hypothetical protein
VAEPDPASWLPELCRHHVRSVPRHGIEQLFAASQRPRKDDDAVRCKVPLEMIQRCWRQPAGAQLSVRGCDCGGHQRVPVSQSVSSVSATAPYVRAAAATDS